ncbi:glycosyltransferase family 4 protein [Stakelama saccharophila]|uniref:Glycosyltransferase family 4 protein n=1 Tax=Stakelama saccharophila TaxID=3075605 RepID=A0ABZ0B6E5_9SPHN|nr:glycosyltransferase family 4 protein [Stakelama sp. W311]WNO52860.1 glycosyltransferase family 4 protein [Stakelama sp. W311]
MTDLRSFHILITADAVGGVWQYSLELARAVSRRGGSATLAILGPAPDDDQRAEAERIARLTVRETDLPLDWMCTSAEPVERAGRVIGALAREVGADLVQVNSPALYAERWFSVPAICAAHGCVATWWDAYERKPLPSGMTWHRHLMRRGLSEAELMVAPSHSFARRLQEAYELPRMPSVVHNGRDFPERGANLAAHDFALVAGRLWDQAKNVRLLDRVAGRLSFPFRAAGADCGPQGERIRVRNLHRLGRLSGAELGRQLARRPAFVSAACFEPFGLAVLEAAAAGCPLVLSDIDTFRELWDGAALFVGLDDERGFVEAIEQAVCDTAARARLGMAARERAQRYTSAAMGERMTRLYAQTVERRAAA